jgi:hypothetical protein
MRARRGGSLNPSWPGFPAIHDFTARTEDVDARDKPGHDGKRCEGGSYYYARLDRFFSFISSA